jgi:hypothetical protein
MARGSFELKSEAVEEMKGYFANERFINHTLKVLDQAEKIAEGERIQGDFARSVIVLASIYHDIGIPESLKKYSSLDAPYQEKEGPAVARGLMAKTGVRPDILERVCFIVGSHHTKDKVDGIDFQIVWEADFIVNIEEKNLVFKKKDLPAAIVENVSTPAGKKLAHEAAARMFPGGA